MAGAARETIGYGAAAWSTQTLTPRRGPAPRPHQERRPIDLRPRGVGEILDAGWRLFSARFGAALAAGFGVWLPIGLLQAVLLENMPTDLLDLSLLNVVNTLATQVASFAVIALFAPLARAELEGRWMPLSLAVRGALPRLPAVVVLAVASGLATTLGTLMCIVPGILLLWMLSVAPVVLALERVGPLEAVRRSARLVRGSFWRWVGWYVVFQAMVLPLSAVPGSLGNPEWRTAIGGFLGSGEGGLELLLILASVLFLGIVSALAASVTAVFYLDCRVRHEALDLEVHLARLVREQAS